MYICKKLKIYCFLFLENRKFTLASPSLFVVCFLHARMMNKVEGSYLENGFVNLPIFF